MLFSGNGGVSGAGVYPSIRAGSVSPAGVRDETHVSKSAPNNHFAAGPHSRVKVSSVRHVGGAGCCPRIRNAWARVWQAERELATLSLSALKFAE